MRLAITNIVGDAYFLIRTYVDPLPDSRARKIFTLWGGGLYTFEDISRFFMESVPGLTLRLNPSGLAEFIAPTNITDLEIDEQLRRLLGITLRFNIINNYVGELPVKLLVHKWLYIYLDQLTTTSNIVDGAPSTLLAIIPASPIKGIINITPSNPTYKKLEVGHIDQLNLRVLDENGTIVNNHDKSMTAVLDIRENDVCSFN